MHKSIVTAGLAILLSAGSAFAALSPEHVAWGKSAAKFLLTPEEAAKWKSINNDGDAQRFEDLFWARRDPTPGTSQNEFRDEFNVRVKFADERYGFARTPGSVSDRGRVVVLLGPPSRMIFSKDEKTIPKIEQGITSDGSDGSLKDVEPPTETWLYERERIPAWAGTQVLDVPFFDRNGSKDWKLGRSNKTNVNELLKMSVQMGIKQPNLTEAPTFAPGAPAPAAKPQVVTVTVPAPQVTAPMVTFKTQSLQTAVDDFKTARGTSYKDAYVTYGTFTTAEGEYFVPVQVYVPQSSGLKADQALTFFGVVSDPTGKVVSVYEEPATLTPTKEDLYFDKSLMLSPGKYNGTFGLAADGKPLTMTTVNMNLTPIEKGTPSVSDLFLSNNIDVMKTAQNPTDPFAFGGLKVVPKGDRVFHTTDELGYFVELRNPGVDAAGNPKIQMSMEFDTTVEKKQPNGKSVKVPKVMKQELQEATVLAVKGVPGHFQIGAFIPLSSFTSGDYKITMKLIDTVNKQVYNREAAFKLKK
ncbi:MAG TPA: GWxTD domain-containing protein [Thermoanaerobaculia bacterium]|nr:GWxTD domain-containing protein [Thermoanaerobaculia bacterium]